MGLPFSKISPLVMGRRPLIRLNSVDLPAPLGPIRATRSPALMASSVPRMISVLPKDLRTLRSSSARPCADALCSLMVGLSMQLLAEVLRFDVFLDLPPLVHELTSHQLEQAHAGDQQEGRAHPRIHPMRV